MQRRKIGGVLEHEGNRLVDQQRLQHAAKRTKQRFHLEVGRTHHGLAGFDLRQIEQIVDEIRQLIGGLADVIDLGLRCSSFLFAVVDQQVAQPDDRVHGRAELVGHVRQESRLQFVGAAKVIRFLVQFGVQRDDTAIGVFQFPVQPREFLLLSLQFVERAKQFLILQLNLLDQAFRTPLFHRLEDLFDVLAGDQWHAGRQTFFQHDACAALVGLDLETIHQAACANDPHPHTG